jgi:DNA-binding GntR family transcriptional regulator
MAPFRNSKFKINHRQGFPGQEGALKREILSGNLLPGQRVDMNEYATQWGISNTPIRDALARLEQVGFVKVYPRRGVYVSRIDQKTFKDIFDLRIALECLATELGTPIIPDEEIERVLRSYLEAGRRLREDDDRTFLIETDYLVHQLILYHCHNTRLIQIMDGLQDMINWARQTVVVHHPEAYETTLPEHIAIVEGIQSRDCTLAVTAMRTHLQNSYERTRSYWEQVADNHEELGEA